MICLNLIKLAILSNFNIKSKKYFAMTCKITWIVVLFMYTCLSVFIRNLISITHNQEGAQFCVREWFKKVLKGGRKNTKKKRVPREGKHFATNKFALNVNRQMSNC